MRSLLLASLLIALATAAGFGASAALTSPELEAARQALKDNLTLGQSLQGKPATGKEAAEAQRLLYEGLPQAREAARQQPDSALAHDLLGSFLMLAYEPAEVRSAGTDPVTGLPNMRTQIVLRQSAPGGESEEGLAELAKATQLDPANGDFWLDYAQALLLCRKLDRALQELNQVWDQGNGEGGAAWGESREWRARAAKLLAQVMGALNRRQDEARWLGEALRRDPGDEESRRRLAEITAAGQGIAWLSYEEGIKAAERGGKPVMMDFWTSVCAWCKLMDRETFASREVIDLSRRFVCIRVDTDNRPDLEIAYRVDSYPMVLFLDPRGKIVKWMDRFVSARELHAAMMAAMVETENDKPGGGR